MSALSLSELTARAEAALAAALPPATLAPERLHEAMRYAVLGGGKRMRPLLVYAAGSALGAPLAVLDPAACAVEMIHAYSLVH
ncbi:MAG: polyprenyl synthetase family protein, partial [Xanthomonadales bacterium]|nr:polyprenyl synthetase family protein [Xanthomonadales bacterium]